MRQVPVRELNQHTADVLARVERGERVEITRNGNRIAILEPAQPSPFSAMIAAGEFRPARRRLPFLPLDAPEAPDSAGLDAVLSDRNDETRW